MAYTFTFLITAVIASLVGMGVGSGGLYIIYLVLYCGIGQLEAQGANLLFFLASSAGALIPHIKKRRIIYPAVLLLGISGAVGAALGAALTPEIGNRALKIAFGVLMVLSGMKILFKK